MCDQLKYFRKNFRIPSALISLAFEGTLVFTKVLGTLPPKELTI